jgi:uncharacterized coiled-coil protein SlyX
MGKVATLEETIAKERRTNRRLRTLIAQLQEQILKNRHDLDVQFTRLAQVQGEVDVLKAELRRDR